MPKQTRKKTQTLQIQEVPKGLLTKIEEQASSQSPPVSRNNWILYLLEKDVETNAHLLAASE